jgi:hypothetical protein
MPRRGLTCEWSIELDEESRSRIVDDDLQLVSPGPPVRTITTGPDPSYLYVNRRNGQFTLSRFRPLPAVDIVKLA